MDQINRNLYELLFNCKGNWRNAIYIPCGPCLHPCKVDRSGCLAAERSCMAEVHVFGRVTNDLQLKMSHRQVPYVSFGLVEWIGRRDTGHRQYFEVWAWGTAALSLADAEIHKDSRIWVQGFLELVDCTRNGGSEKDKRLKLSLTGWQTKPPRTAQRPARKQSPGAAPPPLPPVEVVDGDRERLPE